MSKSFLYSLFIHLLLGALVLVILLQPSKKPVEQRICIQTRSLAQPTQPQPQCTCTPKTTTPPPAKVTDTPPPSKPAPEIRSKISPPMQSSTPAAPVVETPKPVSVPVNVSAVQPSSPPSVKTLPQPSTPIPAPINVEKEYLKINLAEIRSLLIQHQQYPKMAKRLRMQGDVELHFQLNANGSVEDLKIVQSSGFEILDEDAKALILKTAPLFPKPSKTVQLRLPVSYILR